MRKTVNIIFIILIVIVIGFLTGLMFFNKAGNTANKFTGDFIPVTEEFENGYYKGSFETFAGILKTEVEFEIKNSTLVRCEFPKLTATPGYGAAKKILSNINTSGELNFEAVSGATHSCSFARAAIKDAVEKGKQE